MQQCPVCRARRADSAPHCRRCRSDLSELARIESRAAALAGQAVHALARGEQTTAAKAAFQARKLHATPFHQLLADFVEKNIS